MPYTVEYEPPNSPGYNSSASGAKGRITVNGMIPDEDCVSLCQYYKTQDLPMKLQVYCYQRITEKKLITFMSITHVRI